MFIFHSIILGLLATGCNLHNGGAAARALTITTRSTDITCGGRFSKAGDGFAKRPDGCSSWSDNPTQVRDKWGSANFGGVCDEHDRCYYTIGANVDGCNNNFCGGLRAACHNAYCNKLFKCASPLYGPCVAIADTYCLGVRSVAASTYAKAQKLQTEYNSCIAENGGITPPPPPVLCSNGRPEGATWEDVLDGLRCTTTTCVCRNGKIIVAGTVDIPHCVEM